MITKKLIANAIIEEGIPISFKGYSYIFDAVNMAIADFDILKALSKELYPSIAVKNNSTAMAVERAIRNSISKAWSYRDDKKPTNSEFLTFLSYKIISKHSLPS